MWRIDTDQEPIVVGKSHTLPVPKCIVIATSQLWHIYISTYFRCVYIIISIYHVQNKDHKS